MLPFKGSPTYVEKKSSKISNNIVPGKEMSCVCVWRRKEMGFQYISFLTYGHLLKSLEVLLMYEIHANTLINVLCLYI